MTRKIQFRMDQDMYALLQARIEHYRREGIAVTESQLARTLLAEALQIPLNQAVANEIIMQVSRLQAAAVQETLAAVRDRIAQELE